MICQEFEILADSVEEALEKARAGYQAGKLVLEAGEVQQVRMRVLTPDAGAQNQSQGEAAVDEWIEL